MITLEGNPFLLFLNPFYNPSLLYLITLLGTPATTSLDLILFNTTLPAPIIALSPTVIPGLIVALDPTSILLYSRTYPDKAVQGYIELYYSMKTSCPILELKCIRLKFPMLMSAEKLTPLLIILPLPRVKV